MANLQWEGNNMTTSYYGEPREGTSQLDRLAAFRQNLEAVEKRKTQLEAAIRFLEANPDAQALIELIR